MKKTARILAFVLTLCVLLSVSAFASGGPSGEASGSGFAQVDATHWAGSSLTIKSVEYAPEFTGQGYVDSTLFTSVSRIIYDGGEIAVDNTAYTPILTVDGVQHDLYNAANVTYTGDVVITLAAKGDSNNNTGAPFGADKPQSSFGPFYYTAAAYIDDGGYDTERSVAAAQMAGTVTDGEANGLVVDSQGDYFSGVYVNNAPFVINDADMRFVGAGGDDFNGWGAGIVALGSSKVELNRSYVYGTGVLRSGLFTSGSAQVAVNDSVIVTENDTDAIPYDTEDNYAVPMMQQCPFGLGIQGNIRASLACGSGTNTFTNSLVTSNGWAVLSTDSGAAGTTALVANAMVAAVGTVAEGTDPNADFTYEVNGKPWSVSVGRYGETSGYIAYADTGVLDYAYGSAWYSPDYLGIITTGTITMADNCYGYSGRIGFMSHAGGGSSGHGTLVVENSSFDIQDIFAVTQTSGTYTTSTTLDNVDVSLAGSGNDILYLQINSDDNAGGPGNTSNTITDLTYEEYLSCKPASGEPGVTASDLTISNCVVQGNIYNAATDDAVGLNITLDNAEVDGAISSAWTRHVAADGSELKDTVIAQDYFTGTRDGKNGAYDYTMYLRVKAQPAPTVNNPVDLVMQNGAKWMVTGTNYLASLTLDDSSTIMGMGVKMTVDGKDTEIKAGTYTGEIVLTAGDPPARPEGDAQIKAPVIGEAASVEIETAAAFVPDFTHEPFPVEVGDGMTLPFSSVELAVTATTASIYIPDTSKLIECEIINGQWVMEGSDFVDDAIIAAAKAIYDVEGGAPAAGGSGDFAAYIAYLTDVVNSDPSTDLYAQFLMELKEAREEDYTGMVDGTMYGAIAMLYPGTMSFEEFAG